MQKSQTLSERKQHFMSFIQDKVGFLILTFFLQVYLPSVPWLCPTNHRQYETLNSKTAMLSYLDAACPTGIPSLSPSDSTGKSKNETRRTASVQGSSTHSAPNWHIFGVVSQTVQFRLPALKGTHSHR